MLHDTKNLEFSKYSVMASLDYLKANSPTNVLLYAKMNIYILLDLTSIDFLNLKNFFLVVLEYQFANVLFLIYCLLAKNTLKG